MLSPEPVLVTGSHRSGTTWVGKMLSASPTCYYIYEPFRPDRTPCSRCGFQFDFWYQYIDQGNADKHRPHLDHIFGDQYGSALQLETPKAALRLFRKWLRSKLLRATKRPLIKDPIAFLATEWLHETYHVFPIIMIRHPAAVVSSMMRLGWEFDFTNLAAQTTLMNVYLSQFEADIRAQIRTPGSILEQTSLLWKIIYSVARLYQQDHPDWIYLRHEDIASDPLQYFTYLYRKLNLRLTDVARRSIHKHSAPSNPIDLPPEQHGSITRHSQGAISVWKDRLTKEEISQIRHQVEEVSHSYYSDNEW